MSPQALHALKLLRPVIIFLVCYVGISYLWGWVTGWRALARRYRVKDVKGERFRIFWSGMRHPSLSYQWLMSLYVAEKGLGLKIIFGSMLGHPPLMIPWSDIHYELDRKYFLATLSKFTLGSPPMTSLFLWKADLDRSVLWDQIQSKIHAPLNRTIAPSSISKASGRGQIAMIFGITSFFFGFWTGIPAMILGLKEQRAIARGEAPEAGRKIAKRAWILGLVGSLLWLLIIVGLSLLSSH